MKKESEKKVKKPIYKRWWFWLLVVLLVGSFAPDNKSNDSVEPSNDNNASVSDSTPQQQSSDDSVSVSVADTPIVATDETAPEAESQTEPVPEEPPKKTLDDVFKDVTFSEKVPNDVTDNWRMLIYSAPESIVDYAIEYYNKYFADNSEVHFVINKELETTSVLNCFFDSVLSCDIHEYEKGDEKDAKKLAGGDVLEQYRIYLDSGEVENLNIITLSDGTSLDVRDLATDISAALPSEYKNSDWYYVHCEPDNDNTVSVDIQIDQYNDDNDAALRLAADCYNISKTVTDKKGVTMELISVMVMNNHAAVGWYLTEDGEHFELLKDGQTTEVSLS